MAPSKDNTAWSVVLVVFNDRGHVLALTRGFDARNLALPGGHSGDADASVEQTAARVLLEETGLTPTPEAPVVWLRAVWAGEQGQPVYSFHITDVRGKLRPSGKGKPLWVRPKMLFAKTCQFHDKARELLEPLLTEEDEEEESTEEAS